MTLPTQLIEAIARKVAREGGDMDDVDDLVAVWERVTADPQGRVDRLRAESRWRRGAIEQRDREQL